MDMDDPAEQMRNLGICSGAVLIIVIAILGMCYYRLNNDENRQPSGDTRASTISTMSSNSSQVSLPTYYQPPPTYDEVIKTIFEERRKSMEEYLVENEELPPSYQEFVEKHLRIKK